MLGYLLYSAPGQLQPPRGEPGEGWYDTGDIVGIDANGFVTILGRAKRFAKIGGEMVSLGAVEELAVSAWPGVRHGVVSVPDAQKGERLVLVTEQRNAKRRSLLETAKRLGVGEIQVPRTVLAVKELPLLGTGKTDYSAVRALVEALEGEGAAEAGG
jgi:acyl-[acyl-carrier-protein]-phospholipid O-acyltransferase/long-chain-fatty-acid--[acyl-carrier-protein] ligase